MAGSFGVVLCRYLFTYYAYEIRNDDDDDIMAASSGRARREDTGNFNDGQTGEAAAR